MAGVPELESGRLVLETSGLPLAYTPVVHVMGIEPTAAGKLVSLVGIEPTFYLVKSQEQCQCLLQTLPIELHAHGALTRTRTGN